MTYTCFFSPLPRCWKVTAFRRWVDQVTPCSRAFTDHTSTSSPPYKLVKSSVTIPSSLSASPHPSLSYPSRSLCWGHQNLAKPHVRFNIKLILVQRFICMLIIYLFRHLIYKKRPTCHHRHHKKISTFSITHCCDWLKNDYLNFKLIELHRLL